MREGKMMITHFQYKPLYDNKDMPGWRFSFFHKKEKITGIYHPDGRIEWTSGTAIAEENILKQIHEIMLFHEYDK